MYINFYVCNFSVTQKLWILHTFLCFIYLPYFEFIWLMKEHGFEVLTKTPGINKVSKMRSNTTFTTNTTTATTSTIGWGHHPFQRDVHAKTPDLYQVLKIRNTTNSTTTTTTRVSLGDPCENL